MASNLVNVAKFTAASAGTGSFVVSGAVTGYQTPATATAVSGSVYSYRAESADLTQWEIGTGTYTSSNTTITRTPSINSVAGTSAINFTLAPQVGLVALSADLLASVNNLSDLANVQTARQNMGIPFLLRGYLAGLTLSTAGASATFAIVAGTATDSTATDSLFVLSTYTKTTSAWAVGSGNGALDTGAIAASTWYHVFIIKRTDTTLNDFLISLSPTAPTLPASYTLFRRIGSMKTNGSSQWTAFSQNGDEFLWLTPIADASALAITNVVSNITLTVPTGVIVNALFGADYTNTGGAGNVALIYQTAIGTQIAGTPTGNWSLTNSVVSQFVATQMNLRTDTSARISAVSGAAANNSLYIITSGWQDRRGQDT